MFAKRAAIAALERVATSDGDFAAGRRFLARVDPLVRGRAARLMRAAHLDALATTNVRGPESDAHAARLAYLALAGRAAPAEIVDDVVATTRRFDEARASAPGYRRWLWLPTVLVAALVATGFFASGLAGRVAMLSKGGRAVSQQSASPNAGAYLNGGLPQSNAAVRQAFAVDLPDFLIALDGLAGAGTDAEVAGLRADAAAAEARATSPAVRVALGDEAAARLHDLLAAARNAPTAGAAGTDVGADAVLAATSALDDALAAKNLAYFLDGDVIVEGESGRRHVIVYAFEVVHVGVFKSTDRVLALELRRIDRLNWSHALLGFTRPQLRSALVLLDPIDRQLASTILLGLAPNGTVPLFDAADTSTPPEVVRKVEARAGEVVRDEYADASAASARLGEALGRRGALLDTWQKRLGGRGVTLTLPGSLHINAEYRDDLRPLVPERELAMLDEIESSLHDAALDDAFASARDRLVASIERHEVQHRLDYLRPDPLPMPSALERWTGPVEVDGREHRSAARARAEMSAYLAQLARDVATTKADTTLVLRFLLDQKLQGIPECSAALAIAEGLADELKIPIDAPLVEHASIIRERAAALYLAILDKPPEAIRAAAKRVWEKSFRTELPPLERLPSP